MIDRDTLRTARRTVERNGYTVLPPRDKDERDLNRYRTRREVEKEDNRDYRPARPSPRFRDTVEDEQPRRFKPLRQREYDEGTMTKSWVLLFVQQKKMDLLFVRCQNLTRLNK